MRNRTSVSILVFTAAAVGAIVAASVTRPSGLTVRAARTAAVVLCVCVCVCARSLARVVLATLTIVDLCRCAGMGFLILSLSGVWKYVCDNSGSWNIVCRDNEIRK